MCDTAANTSEKRSAVAAAHLRGRSAAPGVRASRGSGR